MSLASQTFKGKLEDVFVVDDGNSPAARARVEDLRFL